MMRIIYKIGFILFMLAIVNFISGAISINENTLHFAMIYAFIFDVFLTKKDVTSEN